MSTWWYFSQIGRFTQLIQKPRWDASDPLWLVVIEVKS